MALGAPARDDSQRAPVVCQSGKGEVSRRRGTGSTVDLMSTPPILSVVGNSGAGKTTLLTKLIAELTRRGLKVAAIKHDAHRFEIDHEGKDSYRLKHAGAEAVIVSSKTKIAYVGNTDRDHDLRELCAMFPIEADIVVTEGYRHEGYPKIEVFRTAHRDAPLYGEGDLFAIASDIPVDMNVPRVHVDDVPALAELVISRLLAG